MAACCLYGAFIMSMFLRSSFIARPFAQPLGNLSSEFEMKRDENSQDPTNNSKFGASISTYVVRGMTCQSCSNQIESMLSIKPGILRVNVSLLLGRMDVLHDRLKIRQDQIAAAIESMGYAATLQGVEASSIPGDFLDYEWGKMFSWSLFFTGPILALQYAPQSFVHSRTSELYSLLLATFSQFGIGLPFYRRSWKAVSSGYWGTISMDFLIAWSTSVAYAVSVFYYIHGIPESYALTSSSLITTASIGKLLESQSRRSVTAIFRAYAQSVPVKARLEGKANAIPTKMLRSGDVIAVEPGERIPCDGKVSKQNQISGSGSLEVDESFQTGESRHVLKEVGDDCLAGTINSSRHTLFIEVFGTGRTRMEDILRTVLDAQGFKSETQLLAERIASVFVPMVLVLSFLTFIYWLPTGVFQATRFMTAVLMIACPCAFGLSAPTAVMIGTALGAEKGIIVKSGAQAFECASRVTVVVLDKTGTVTNGEMEILGCKILNGWDETTWWMLIHQAELQAEHWAAATILKHTLANFSHDAEIFSDHMISEYKFTPGRGVRCLVDDIDVMVGSLQFLKEAGCQGIDIAEYEYLTGPCDSAVVMVAFNNRYEGNLVMQDALQSGARAAIDQLKAMSLKVVMMTGDRFSVAQEVAATLGVEQFFSGMAPNQKAEMVMKLRKDGEVVAMVGDGINDAPALASANVGIAMQRGTSLAIESADIVLLESSISQLVHALELAHATFYTIQTNLLWACVYNLIALPIAMGFGARWGIVLSPTLAAVLMIGSSFGVTYNSLHLRKRVVKESSPMKI